MKDGIYYDPNPLRIKWKKAELRPVEELGKVITDAFPKLWVPVKVVLAFVFAPLLLKHNPICPALVIVGPPADSKGTLLALYDVDNLTEERDKFTPKSFVSHAANKSDKQLANIDLLPVIRGKVMITPDLAPLARGKESELQENYGIVARVLDGQGFISQSGSQGARGYKGDYLFAWLGASTPLSPEAWRIMANVGTRLFFLCSPHDDPTEEQILARYTGPCKPYIEKVRVCKQSVTEFVNGLYGYWTGIRGVEWDDSRNPPEIILTLHKLAKLVARLRATAHVVVKEGDSYSYAPPLVEVINRALEVLVNAAKGHALIHGRDYLAVEDLEAPALVALSSGPLERVNIMKLLVKQSGQASSSDVEKHLKVSRPTAHKLMKELEDLEIVSLSQPLGGFRIELRPEFQWVLGQDFLGMVSPYWLSEASCQP